MKRLLGEKKSEKVLEELNSVLTLFKSVYKMDLENYLSGIIYHIRDSASKEELKRESNRLIRVLETYGLLDIEGDLVVGGYKNVLKRSSHLPKPSERYALFYLSFLRRTFSREHLEWLKPALESEHECLEVLIDKKVTSLTFLETCTEEKLERAIELITADEMLSIRSRTEPFSEIVAETEGIESLYLMPDESQYQRLIQRIEMKNLSVLIDNKARIAVYSGYSKPGYDFEIKTKRSKNGDE